MIPTYDAINAVDLSAVPTLATDRHIPRKEQAKLLRGLLKKLRISGVSVTTPNYSMASQVDVKLPHVGMADADFIGPDGTSYRCEPYGAMPAGLPAKAKRLAHRAAVEKVQQVIAKAFPNHDDRSDSMTDYFDSCWCVD